MREVYRDIWSTKLRPVVEGLSSCSIIFLKDKFSVQDVFDSVRSKIICHFGGATLCTEFQPVSGSTQSFCGYEK